MGLDMYLTGSKFLFTNWEHPEKNRKEDGIEIESVRLRLAYWRKHPNLHGYIVQTFADGKDECQEIELCAVTTEESLAFSALLVLACCKVHTGKTSAKEAVGIDTQFTAEATCEAIDMFQRIFGKNPDGFVRESLLNGAREVAAEGTNAADKLLAAVCANHKPA